jgi:hypothetical protein
MPMISLILAVAATPVQPSATAIRPVPAQPLVTGTMLATRKQRMAADARALLDRAERARIIYRPGAVSGQLSTAELEASIAETKDSLADMSEMDQLQLHMAMDRLSKAMSALSNMLKKIGDTQDSITNNIK